MPISRRTCTKRPTSVYITQTLAYETGGDCFWIPRFHAEFMIGREIANNAIAWGIPGIPIGNDSRMQSKIDTTMTEWQFIGWN